MGRNYPIWNEVQACVYETNKSWGARDTCFVQVQVGSGKQNSEVLVEHVTTCRLTMDKDIVVYTFGVKIPGSRKKTIVITRKYYNTKTKEFYARKPKHLP